MAKHHGKGAPSTLEDFRAFHGCLISLILGAALWIAVGVMVGASL